MSCVCVLFKRLLYSKSGFPWKGDRFCFIEVLKKVMCHPYNGSPLSGSLLRIDTTLVSTWS